MAGRQREPTLHESPVIFQSEPRPGTLCEDFFPPIWTGWLPCVSLQETFFFEFLKFFRVIFGVRFVWNHFMPPVTIKNIVDSLLTHFAASFGFQGTLDVADCHDMSLNCFRGHLIEDFILLFPGQNRSPVTTPSRGIDFFVCGTFLFEILDHSFDGRLGYAQNFTDIRLVKLTLRCQHNGEGNEKVITIWQIINDLFRLCQFGFCNDNARPGFSHCMLHVLCGGKRHHTYHTARKPGSQD